MTRLTVRTTRRADARLFLTLALLGAVLNGKTASSQPAPPLPPAPAPRPMPAIAPTPRMLSVPLASLAPLMDDMWRLDIERAALSVARADLDAARLFDDALSGLSGRTVRASGYRTEPPVAWDAQDPADSLYKNARQALTSDEYRKAADLFKQIHERYPKSSYAADAPYWEAFALQRLGGDGNLTAALRALALQQSQYPRAATRGDAAGLRSRVQSMLARRGDSAMASTLMGRAESASRDGCPGANEDERVDALNAVTMMDPEKAMPILKKVLARREPCTQQLRRTAVYLVASRKQPEAADILMNVAKSDPDREVREQAVFWMASVPTEEATTMLITLVRQGNDLDLRKRAVYALSRSKSPRAATTLRELALDGNTPEELRGDVLTWYLAGPARAAGEDAMGFLKDVYAKAESEQSKQLVVMAMASQRSESSRSFLLALALNERESTDLRRFAVNSLGSSAYAARSARTFVSGGTTITTSRGVSVAGVAPSSAAATESAAAALTAALAALTQVYDKASAQEVRSMALMSLGALRDHAGVDKLIDIARNEKNPELRREAVAYLSRIKDPRAMALMQEIIDR